MSDDSIHKYSKQTQNACDCTCTAAKRPPFSAAPCLNRFLGGSVSKQRLFETQQIAKGSTMSAIFWVCLTDFFDVYNCYQLLTMSDFLSTNVQIGSGFPGCKLAPSPHGLSTSAKVMDLPRDWDYSWLDPHRYSHSIIQEWYSLWLGYIVKCILKFAFGQCSNRCTLDRFR